MDVAGSRPIVERLSNYGPNDAKVIIGDETDPFQGPEELGDWMPKTEHFGIYREGALIGHAGLVESTISINGEELPIVGFGGVIVAHAWRGKGLARDLMVAATKRAREMGPDFGLLFCHDDRVGLYAKLGWTVLSLDTRVTVLQRRGEAFMPMRTMWTALYGGRDWPPGGVHLHSLPM
jgi:predicted GNAT family N-acyltransferase